MRNRQSIRLRGYNYAMPGTYFITICAQDRICIFGDIINDKMILNKNGILVSKSWQYLHQQYAHVELDEYIIMPNHLHGIVIASNCRGGSRTARDQICTAQDPHNNAQNPHNNAQDPHNNAQNPHNNAGGLYNYAGGSRTAPTMDQNILPGHKPLGRLIGVFKTVSTKHINKLRGMSGIPVWQRNYYEHIIRNEIELQRIRQYIKNNPIKWQNDNYWSR